MSEIYELIKKRRSIRGFTRAPVPRKALMKIVDAARLAPSSGNLQMLKFAVVSSPDRVRAVFDQTRWAAHIAPAGNPTPETMPTAFVVILQDTRISRMNPGSDAGAAAENMMLAALGEGIASCWIGNCNRRKIAEILKLDPALRVHTVIAFGYPAHESFAEDIEDENGSVIYRRDEAGNYHVPKRRLKDIMLEY